MLTVEKEFLTTIRDGLIRATATTVSSWGLRYVVLGNPIPGPMTFKHHPWSKELMDCQQDWVGSKAAQMAFTHALLMRAMFTNDVLKQDVLYILPKRTPDAADFSKTKFDSLLQTSPHLHNLYDSVRNVGLKQAGSVNFYLRGARSRSALKLISVAKKMFDEYDEMPQANVTLAEERSSGYFEEDVQTIKISTPTIPEYGIHKELQASTQEHYFFRCPNCSQLTEFIFPDSLIVTGESSTDLNINNSYLKTACGHEIKNQAEKFDLYKHAKWQSTANANAEIRGFYINQFYSMTVTPKILAKKKLKAEESNEPLDWQEWHNSSGGVPHIPEGARVTESVIKQFLSDHSIHDRAPQGLLTMGVDVGHKWLHIIMDQWFFPLGIGPNLNSLAIKKTVYIDKRATFAEIAQLKRDHQIFMTVVDSEPDHRDALEFVRTFKGHAYLWYPNYHKKGKDLNKNDDDMTVSCNRTSWLDLSQGRFKRPFDSNGKKPISLPKDTPQEYIKHISALVRKPTRDRDGHPTATYLSTGADHYAFSNMFSEIALVLAVSISENRSVGDLL